MKVKILVWFAISIVITFLRAFFSQNYILESRQFDAYPFVILMLCIAFGWLKRNAILSQMNKEELLAEPVYLAAGVLITIMSTLMPFSSDPVFLLFNFFLTSIGLFMVFFGAAAYLPSLLLFVYGFSISFPILLTKFFGTEYAIITTSIVAHTTSLLYPVGFEGQVLSIINAEGVRSLLYIDAGCSGSASIAIFLTVFALMMIDIKPRKDRILPLFLFGMVGTSVQNIFRLVLLLASNYHFGPDAMWQMHDYAGYILFPAWFTVFIYVYLKIGVEVPQVTLDAESEQLDE